LQQSFPTRGSQSSTGKGATGAATALAPRADRPYDLVDMAQRDLNAALQLLAQRAEYITQAGGAAIALRRDGRDDLMCRARTGVNAPEVGALLSTERGLSGESVRTGQPLRCNDAAHDARVNREICRELGIASVMVMPIVNDDHVMGVFELFSEKKNAFGERDLAALQRLSEMVGIAVRLACAAGAAPQSLKSAVPVAAVTDTAVVEKPQIDVKPLPPITATVVAPPPAPARQQPAKLWSALDTRNDAQPSAVHDQSRIPPVLRNLRKCDACGFPVSPGRSLCVECEEKKWRGQLTIAPKAQPLPPNPSAAKLVSPASSVAVMTPPAPPAPAEASRITAQETATPALSTFTLSAGLEPSQSWLSTHKYLICAILAAAGVIAAFVLR